MNWKKEIKSWGIWLAALALLYFTGWMTPIMGGLQNLVLSTGLIKPNLTLVDKSQLDFDYTGQFLTINDQTLNLEQYRGKTVFINLWATWCPPCLAEMPHISELYKKVKDQKDLEFLMIALDKDFEKSKSYIEKKGFTFPVVHAAYGLNASLQSESIPTTLVVSPSGKIIFYQEGMSNFNTEAFIEFLKETN
ncbi:TlpA family protein disulfide reductase [Pararhodonellum marinum]|uniref:TlpA family protein disulfide reductase n=1 Tax=Pararhodonellum marinum TaxID=2755358 RepID=UPI00188E8B14|nr:TlpA disulfide reductase family protein [Pararhodonellum marinum]